MADDLNSLLAANRSSSVLQGIANPAQVNPLAAINSAAQTAGNVFSVRALQAQQQLGDILQQSTDPNGNVDYGKAHTLAAQAGPGVQMGMRQFLLDNASLRTSQIANTGTGMRLQGLANLSLAVDPSDQNLRAITDNLKANGMPNDQAEREYERLKLMSPDERRRNAHRLAAGSIEHFLGTPGVQTTGSQFVPSLIIPPQAPGFGAPTPTLKLGGGAIDQTVSPDFAAGNYTSTVTSADQARAAERGIRLEVGAPLLIPRSDIMSDQGLSFLLPPAVRINMQQQAGGRGPPTRNPDGTVPSPSNPAVTTPPAPAPVRQLNVAPPPTVTAPAPGPRVPISSLDAMGGVQTASANPLEAPTLGPAAPPSPLVPGDVAAIQAGMAGARDNRLPGTQLAGAGASYGPGLNEQAAAKLSQDRLAADSSMQADYAKNILPYTQSLHLYGRGMTTGPGTEWFNGVKGGTGAVLRSMGLPTPFDSTKEYDEIHKWLTQLVTSNPVATGSDARLASTLAGNAHTGIHELAGEDMVKVGAALMRMNAAVRSDWDTMGPAGQVKYGGYYSNYLRDVNKGLDLRGFAWDMLNPAQRKTLAEDLAAHRDDPSYAQNIINSREMARRNGYFGPQRAMP